MSVPAQHDMTCTRRNGECVGWHCPRCGAPTSSQGHRDCPGAETSAEHVEWAREQEGLSDVEQTVLLGVMREWPTTTKDLAAKLGMPMMRVEDALRELARRGLHLSRGE